MLSNRYLRLGGTQSSTRKNGFPDVLSGFQVSPKRLSDILRGLPDVLKQQSYNTDSGPSKKSAGAPPKKYKNYIICLYTSIMVKIVIRKVRSCFKSFRNLSILPIL